MEIAPNSSDLEYLEKIKKEADEQQESWVDNEIARLDEMVDNFTLAMKFKLHSKVRQGYHGWDREVYQGMIVDKLVSHVRRLDKGDKSQAVDIGNLAAFIWNLDMDGFKDENKS